MTWTARTARPTKSEFITAPAPSRVSTSTTVNFAASSKRLVTYPCVAIPRTKPSRTTGRRRRSLPLPDGVRCGRIRYLNDLPIYAAFDEGAVQFPGEFTQGVPAQLNMDLIRGSLDMGPISSAQFARHADELTLIDHLCIGARDYAWSVLLISPTPPHLLDGAEIAVTRESASGRALLQILLERRYGVRAAFVSTEDPMYAAKMHQPTLLIGDQALDARDRFDPAMCYDLAHEWHEWTEADMVFAVWVVRND